MSQHCLAVFYINTKESLPPASRLIYLVVD